MSWNRKITFYKEIEKQLENKSMDLDSFLDEEYIIDAVCQNLPNVTFYVVDHLSELINMVAFPHEKGSEIQKTCIMILTSLKGVDDSLVKKYFDMLIDKVRNPESDRLSLMYVMNHLINATSGDILLSLAEPDEFAKFILGGLSNYHVYEFMHSLLSKEEPSVQKFVSDVMLDELLFIMLDSCLDPECIFRILSLLYNLVLLVPKGSSICTRFQHVSRVKMIFDVGIHLNNGKIAEICFRIILALLNLCDLEAPDGTETSPFDEIMNMIEENCHSLVIYIQKDYIFAADKRHAVELVQSVIVTQEAIPQYIFTLVAFLTNQFFEQKTNSFLHLAFCSLFEELASHSSEFQELVTETRIIPRILEVAENRWDSDATYWGFIHKITKILIPLNLAREYDEQWKRYIRVLYNEDERIMSHPYGTGVSDPRREINPDPAEPTRDLSFLNALGTSARKKPESSSDSDFISASSSDDSLFDV